jgi:glutamine amidotransferase
MQLMATRGLEHGSHDGLGWIEGAVERLSPDDPALKIPHMGWNELEPRTPDHPIFAGIAEGAHAYFVHSYGFRAADPAAVLASVDYGGPVAAIIGRANMLGCQFHPEKSQAVGLRLITNFLRWRP